jgi:N-acetylmuramoyl-L-alanine amidase
MDANNVIVFPTAEISMITLSQENVSEIDSIYNFKYDTEVEEESESQYELLGNVENICYDIYSGDDYISNEISSNANVVVEDALASIEGAMVDLDEIAKAEAEKKAAEEAAKAAEEAAKLAATYVDNPNMVIKLTNEELDLLERLVQCEAKGEDTVGKILVANVVINRVNSKKFPNTVSGVINAKKQFAPVTSGIINTCTVSNDTKDAVARALSGEDYSDGALFFISRKNCSSSSASWFDRNLTKVVEHGGHEFFK